MIPCTWYLPATARALSHCHRQVILFGLDESRIVSAATDAGSVSAYVPAYAQARWSSFANVQWCIANDVQLQQYVDVIGQRLAQTEPWGTLITR